MNLSEGVKVKQFDEFLMCTLCVKIYILLAVNLLTEYVTL